MNSRNFDPTAGITYRQAFIIIEEAVEGSEEIAKRAEYYSYAQGFGKVLKKTDPYFTTDVDSSGKPILTEENEASLRQLHETAVTNFNSKVSGSRARSISGESNRGSFGV